MTHGITKYFEDERAFRAAMTRLHETCGTRTQVDLAEFIGVRQSSISDARRRRNIPDSWLLTVMRRTGADPDWLLRGTGPRWRLLSEDFKRPVDREVVEAAIRAEVDNLDAGQLIARLREKIPGVAITIGSDVPTAPLLRAVGDKE